MLRSLVDRFHPEPLRSRVEASIRQGTGLYRQEWLFEEPLTGTSMHQLGEDVVEWCRERMAASRRPYGIDQMALALACAVPGGPPLSSTTFGVFRPVEFYTSEGIAARLSEYLKTLPIDALNEHGEPIRFAAALFSWGDVARATVFADEADAAD